jgi:hypothetical protein
VVITHKKRPAAGLIQAAGRRKFEIVVDALEYAKHDGADKGEGNIRSDNAQSADNRTERGHFRSLPGSHAARLTPKLANRSLRKKSGLLSLPARRAMLRRR